MQRDWKKEPRLPALDARRRTHEQGTEEARLSLRRPHDVLRRLTQAAGLVNDHGPECFRYAQVRKLL